MNRPHRTQLAPTLPRPTAHGFAHRFALPVVRALGLALLLSHAHAAAPIDGGVQGLQAEVHTRLSGLLGAAATPLRIASPTEV